MQFIVPKNEEINRTIERPGKGRECRTCRHLWNWEKIGQGLKYCGGCDNWTRNNWVPDCPDGTLLAIDEKDED